MRGLSRWWHGRGKATGVGEAMMGLSRAERNLKHAKLNPHVGHDLRRLEQEVAAAEWLLVVARTRAEADITNAQKKKTGLKRKSEMAAIDEAANGLTQARMRLDLANPNDAKQMADATADLEAAQQAYKQACVREEADKATRAKKAEIEKGLSDGL